MSAEQKNIHKNIWIAWTLLFLGLLATTSAAIYTKKNIEAEAKKDFEFACSQIQLRISARMEAHAQILRSAAALFDATGDVTRETWHAFTFRQKVEQNLPGIQGLGFSLVIPYEQFLEHTQRIRSEGFPNYNVRPEGDREIYTSIIYLEPFSGRNLRAFGFDMLSEPVRRMAMERARDMDAAILSGKVTLVQETDQDVQAGALMYVPVYRRGMNTDTPEQRRAAIYGWVYSPYRMNDLMQGIMKGWESEAGKLVRLQIFDNNQMSSDSLLYDSNPKESGETLENTLINLQSQLDINGHRWHLHFTRTDRQTGYSQIYGVISGGMIISLLLFWLIISILNTRFNAQQLAEHLTVDLRESEGKYSIIFNNEIYAICIFDLKTLRLIDVNDAYCRLYGYTRKELISGMTIHDITVEHQVSDAATSQAVREGTIFIPLRHHKKKDGTVFPVEIVGGAYLWKGQKVMFGLAHDITERKAAEDKLSQTMREQQIILENSNIGISKVVDRKHVWVNYKTLEIFQYPKEEMEGHTTRKLYPSHEAYEQLGRDAYDVLAQGLTYETVRELLRSDGVPIWIRYNGKAVDPFDMSQGTIWILEDITKRRETYEALRASEERFRKLFEFNAAVKLIIDPDSGSIIDANKTAAIFYGWSIEELKKMQIQDINTLPPEAIKIEMEKAKLSGSMLLEFRHRRSDSSIRDVEVFSSMIEVSGKDFLYSIIHDITERKQAKEALFKSEKRLELALKATHEAVWDWDLLNNNLYYSPRWWSMIGYEVNELEADPDLWRRVIHPEDLERANLIFIKALAGETTFDVETRLLHKDGHYVQVHTQGFILRDDTDTPIRVSGTNTDLTERKKIEKERIQWERQLQQLQKVESLNRMAGAIAHNFNNLLGAVIGNLEMAMQDLSGDDDAFAFLTEAMKASERAAEISGLMLTYLGQSVSKHESINLTDVCRNSLTKISHSIPAGITLEANLPSSTIEITANANQIHQVIKNLVINASEAIADNCGNIHLVVRTISLSEIPNAHRFPLDWNSKENIFACIELKDTASGISDTEIDKIFDPFYSTKFTGRGLGLAVVLGIMRAHNGVITVESQRFGSTFRVIFPLSDQNILFHAGG